MSQEEESRPQRGAWANWNGGGWSRTPEPQDDQWGTMSLLAQQTWAFPAKNPPPPPIHPADTWISKMEQELYLARTMLNEDAYASRAWITCDVMGDAETQGDRDLELYLELLMTLELKNKNT